MWPVSGHAVSVLVREVSILVHANSPIRQYLSSGLHGLMDLRHIGGQLLLYLWSGQCRDLQNSRDVWFCPLYTFPPPALYLRPAAAAPIREA
jgi:hypothetical protein